MNGNLGAISHRLDRIKSAVYAIEGIKRGIDEEMEKDTTNGYTVGGLLAGIDIVTASIADRLYEINDLLNNERIRWK
jgi:hypothetical protein